MTRSTTPLALRRHLSRSSTNVRASKALVEQAFFPDQGWVTLDEALPAHRASFRLLGNLGATVQAIGYTVRGVRTRADFTTDELRVA